MKYSKNGMLAWSLTEITHFDNFHDARVNVPPGQVRTIYYEDGRRWDSIRGMDKMKYPEIVAEIREALDAQEMKV